MTLALVQSKAAASTTDEVTVTLDSTPTVGNTLVAAYYLTANPPTTPAGWTAIDGDIAGASIYVALYYRVVEGGDPAAWSFSGTPFYAGGSRAVVMEWDAVLTLVDDAETYTGLTDDYVTSGPMTPTGGLPALLIGALAGWGDGGSAGIVVGADGTTQVDKGGTGPTGYADKTTLTLYEIVASPAGDYSMDGTPFDVPQYCVGRGAAFSFPAEPCAELPAGTGAFALDVYRIDPPGDTITYLATLDDAFGTSIRPVRNAPGSGQFSINRSSAHATADILTPGNLVKVRIAGVDPCPVFAFFMDPGNFTLVSSNEQGGETITIGGRGALSYVDRAIWLLHKYGVPWWPDDMADPPVGAEGALRVNAGTYRYYAVSGSPPVITGYTMHTVTAFDAYYEAKRVYAWPSAKGSRFLVTFMAGEPHAGVYFSPYQAGVQEVATGYKVHTGTTIDLADVVPPGDAPGALLERMYQEGISASRPAHPIPLATIDFTPSLDSDGNAWTTTDASKALGVELGERYLDTVAKLLGTGVIDIEMGPDLDLHAWNAQGRDLTGAVFGAGVVRFEKGINIADELARERADLPTATWVEVVALPDGVYKAVDTALVDAASRVTREASASGESVDDDALAAIGLASLDQRLVRSDAIAFHIAAGDDAGAGRYLPGPPWTAHGSFWLGDLVRVHTGSGEQDFHEQDFRVAAITMSEDEAGNLEVVPELGSVLGEAERALYAPQTSFPVRPAGFDTALAESETPDLAEVLGNGDDAQQLAARNLSRVDGGSDGDTLTVQAGTATGGSGGGDLELFGGDTDSGGGGGLVTIRGGDTGGGGGAADVNIKGGSTSGGGGAGSVVIEGGDAGAGVAGDVQIRPGTGATYGDIDIAANAAQIFLEGDSGLVSVLTGGSSGLAGEGLISNAAGAVVWGPIGGADDQTAAEVPFTPAGTVAATNVQAAIEEVASEAANPASASQAEMEAGTEAALRSVSPLRVAQAIAALGGGGSPAGTLFTDTIAGDGGTTSFALTHTPSGPWALVSTNGAGLLPSEFSLSGGNVVFGTAPVSGSESLVTYLYGAMATAHTHVWNETPSGTIGSDNPTFTLLAAPNPGGSLLLFKNGLVQRAGAGNDFTLSSLTITFLAGNLPQSGDLLVASYTT